MDMIEAGIEDVTRSIWANVLSLPVERAPDGDRPDEPTVTCFIQVEGEWDGAVVFQLPSTLAVVLTTAMFQSATVPNYEEVRDAVGEITNILAGNIKALLPQPSRINLPVVASGRDYRLEMLRTSPVAAVAFSSQGDTFVVTVLQQSETDET